MYAEGDNCPDCTGILKYREVENCSCHINPPCNSCTDNKLVCPTCDWSEDEDPPYKRVEPNPVVYTPRKLDNTKIDFRSKMHTNSSMIKEGVYPEGTSQDEVRQKVKGSFGGRFEYFGNGMFKFIAYTD